MPKIWDGNYEEHFLNIYFYIIPYRSVSIAYMTGIVFHPWVKTNRFLIVVTHIY